MVKVRPIGKCKLCGELRELCDSHYLPKCVYAYARADELKNPNPLMSINGELKQISDQYRDYVFCEGCEGRLNKHGEKWVLANIPHSYDGRFPLQDALGPLDPILIKEALNVYDLSGAKAFDVEKLVYFGMSVFWRGAVHRWKSTAGQEAPEVDLGGYEEPIRKFLLGTSEFPNDVVLTLDIWPYKKVLLVSYPVLTEQLPGCRRYWFYVPGLLFFLFLGSNVPQDALASSLLRGIASLDLHSADSVLRYTTEGIKSQHMGPKVQDMLRQIAAVRSKTSFKE